MGQSQIYISSCQPCVNTAVPGAAESPVQASPLEASVMPSPTSRWSTLTLNQFIVVTIWVPLFGGAMDYDGRSHSDFKVTVTGITSPTITPNGVKPIIDGEATGPPPSSLGVSPPARIASGLVVDVSTSAWSSWAEKSKKLEEKLVELKFATIELETLCSRSYTNSTSKYAYACRCSPTGSFGAGETMWLAKQWKEKHKRQRQSEQEVQDLPWRFYRRETAGLLPCSKSRLSQTCRADCPGLQRLRLVSPLSVGPLSTYKRRSWSYLRVYSLHELVRSPLRHSPGEPKNRRGKSLSCPKLVTRRRGPQAALGDPRT